MPKRTERKTRRRRFGRDVAGSTDQTKKVGRSIERKRLDRTTGKSSVGKASGARPRARGGQSSGRGQAAGVADTTRFSVSLPDALLAELDRRVTRRGYASRSELVRDLIRERLVEDTWAAGDKPVVGVLTIAYDHAQRDLSRKLADAQHSRYANILCTTHVHLDRRNCLEIIIIRGRPDEIERIALASGGLKGVRFAKLTRASVVPH